MMICIVIKGPTFEEAKQQIDQATKYGDMVELRLDCFAILDLAALKKLRASFAIPMIFTLRGLSQGGNYIHSEERRFAEIRRLMSCEPEYFDIENSVSPDYIKEISNQFPSLKLIVSYHNFNETPLELEKLYQEMQKIPATFYKIAVTAQNCVDTMRLICWAKKFDNKLIAISMGYHGQISRILSPIFGSPMTYAALEETKDTPIGQLTAKKLRERFNHHLINQNTAVYGLIGDPIDKSISDETHNNFIRVCGLDAIYVKMQVNSSDLGAFIKLARQLPFKGISVTMPLKEKILDFTTTNDSNAQEMGCVNTLHFESENIIGYNTDGAGALNAIESECKVIGKTILIIGAGGAARAIAVEALRRGAIVTIVNRNLQKARMLAQSLNCEGLGLESMSDCCKRGYSILINCTPSEMPIDPKYILEGSFLMDIITKPRETPFIKMGIEKGCIIIYGYKMFVEQAIGQFKVWFNNPEEHSNVEKNTDYLKEIACQSLLNS